MAERVPADRPRASCALARVAAARFVRTAILAIVAAVAAVPLAGAQSPGAGPIVVFHTEDFWLNLHQFLYVLGRHEAGMPDSTRRAVAGAPGEAEKVLTGLTADEQRLWRGAVTFYADGLSRQDAVFDRELVGVANAMVRAGGDADLNDPSLDPRLVTTLEAAAQIYRRTWWPAHRGANERWVKAMRPFMDQYGASMLSFLTKAYQLPWPEAGYPVRVTAYTNWAGAFSTDGNLLLVSSLDPGTRGSQGLEIVFHEAMHQWDEEVDALLRAAAGKQKRQYPEGLSHAMIFYTAGEAARTVVPGHVPYAEANGLWPRGMAAFRSALDTAWKPYLDGKGTRDEAFAALVAR